MTNSIFVKKVRPLDYILYALIFFFAALVITMVGYFIIYIVANGLKLLSLDLLTTAENPRTHTIGILPAIINTGYMIVITLLLAVPLGVGSAIYLNEYAKNRRLIAIIEYNSEILAGIPSIIFGVFGYIFFCLWLNLGVSLLSGALTLTIMVLPTIIRTTQEALRAVPKSYREGAMGLGATKWFIIRTILLPSALPGVLTSIILSVGRIVGESAALILVAGGTAVSMPRGNFLQQILSSGATLSVSLWSYAQNRGETDVGFSIAFLLLFIVLMLNLFTKLAKWLIERKNTR